MDCGSCGKYKPIKGSRRGRCTEPKRKQSKTESFPWNCLCNGNYWIAKPEINEDIEDLKREIECLKTENRTQRELLVDLRDEIIKLNKVLEEEGIGI
jgi:hypothetical protein